MKNIIHLLVRATSVVVLFPVILAASLVLLPRPWDVLIGCIVALFLIKYALRFTIDFCSSRPCSGRSLGFYQTPRAGTLSEGTVASGDSPRVRVGGSCLDVPTYIRWTMAPEMRAEMLRAGFAVIDGGEKEQDA